MKLEAGFYWYKWKPERVPKKLDVKILYLDWSVFGISKNQCLVLFGVDEPMFPEETEKILDKMIIGPKIENPKEEV